MLKQIIPLLLSLALLLSACGGQAPADPTPTPTSSPMPSPLQAVEFALPVTGGSLHPILGQGRVNTTLSGLMWEGLFALDGTFTPQNVLCQSWAASEDGLTWTFWLRQDVTFSDGGALAPADVVHSLHLAKSAQSRFAGRLADVRTVREEGGAVVLTLATPNGNLPALLDIPIVRGESEQPLGTGPYAMEGENMALALRPDWWQKKALPIPRIPLRTLPEAGNLISAFDTGDVSLVTADLTGTNAVGYGGTYESWDYPTTGMVYLGFNCAPKRLCADPALRAALSHGLDRNTVAGALYANHAAPAALPVSPVSPLYRETAAAAMGYSPQLLADQLALAGFTKGSDGLLVKGRTPLALDLIVNTDNSFRLSVGEYIAGELGRAGIAVNLRRLPWGDYQKALEKGDFDLYIGETMLTADFDPSALMAPGGALNFGKYADAQTNTLLDAYLAATGAARGLAADAFYARFAQEVPFAVLCFKTQSVLTQWGIVSGLSPTQQDPFFGMEHWKLNMNRDGE